MQDKNTSTRMTRRDLLRIAGTTGAALALGPVLAACAKPGGAGGGVKGELRWMTWSDHYFQEQLSKVAADTGVTCQPTLFSDNIDAFTKLKQTTGGADLVSGDALWVPHYHQAGLIEVFDLDAIDASKELYPVSKEAPFWRTKDGFLGFPFAWSPIQVSYNPKYVTGNPDSWEVLWDPKYEKKLVLEKQPTDVMAMMGVATGAKDSLNMTADELARAKDALARLKPNILKFLEQNQEGVKAMVDESAWLSISNLGQADRVKDAGGPEVVSFVPKEGTIGFADAEMIVKGGNRERALAFLDAADRAEWAAMNFLEYGRPLFNEKAYKLLVDQGHEDRARRYLYDRPELAFQMALKGPASDQQAYVDAFNEAIAG